MSPQCGQRVTVTAGRVAIHSHDEIYVVRRIQVGYLEPEKQAVLDAAIKRYVAAMNALDEQQFLSCFRNNCVIRDPYGASIYQGGDELRHYFQTMRDTWQRFELRAGRIYYGGDERAVFSWEVSATAKNGKTAQFDGIIVMTLEGPLIDGLESYWDAPAMFEQIKD
jgi:ketosteroid isomerase-like protein